MAHRNFVEIGRVALIGFGRDARKLCVIVDVIDHNRALIDGPVTGVRRQAIQFKRLRLTKFKIKIPHSTSTKTVRKAWEKANISELWKETPLYRRLEASERRAALTDYDRFKYGKIKQKVNREIKTAFFKLKAKAKKAAVAKPKKPIKKAAPSKSAAPSKKAPAKK